MTVDQLARELQVSASTIRRDLERLGREGALLRVRGGAAASVRPERTDVDNPFDEVAAVHREEKEAVAAAAANLVGDGDVALLDMGTTTALLARRLRGRPVIVLTSSLAVVDELRDDHHTELILLGGVLRRRYHCLAGTLTEDALRQVRARWAFLGTSGIAPDGAILDTTLDEVPIKRAMIQAADRVVVLADRHKLPGQGTLLVCEGGLVDVLVTNVGSDPATLAACAAQGMEVLTT